MSGSLIQSTDVSSEDNALTTNQERLLYLFSLYSDQFLSIPDISVLVFEGCKEPEIDGDSESEDVSVSRRTAEDVSLHISDKYTFTYTFFQSFADVCPNTQVQVYSSMVLKNDIRYFKKQGLLAEEKQDVETGLENCYKITPKGRELILATVSEKSKIRVHNVVYAPGTANLLQVVVKNKSFFITSQPHASPASDYKDEGDVGSGSSKCVGYEKKSGITRPQEQADEDAANQSSEDEEEVAREARQEMRRQSFQLSSLQQSLAVIDTTCSATSGGIGGDAKIPEEAKSGVCVMQ